MRILNIIWVAAGLFAQAGIAASSGSDDTWWYRKPADKYWEGLPLSNGRLAAMIPGQLRDEAIVINDETLWSGSPYDPNNPEGPKIVKQVQQLLFKGEFVAAQKLCQQLMSRPISVQHYQPLGELRVRFEGTDKASDYRRELDMDSAIARVTYRSGDTQYTREVFTSYPDQVFVMRITADKPGRISLAARLGSIQPSGRSVSAPDQGIVISGVAETVTEGKSADPVIPSKLRWQAQMRVLADGGKTGNCRIAEDEERTATCVSVTNANSVTIVLAAGTNFVKWNDVSGDEKKTVAERMRAARSSYSTLKSRHLRDWQPQFLACKLDLGGHEASKDDTTTRMERLRQGAADPLFEAQYFQYGRYLLLAVSRTGTLAFNNHNVWLNNMEGRWQGRWTLNINLQECYWPAESTNLASTNEPLLTFVESLSEAGARTAREMYGNRGWVAHLGTDIWMNTVPTDLTGPGIWPTGGAWLLQNLWEHYAFEPDRAYLKRLYTLLRGSSEFFLDFLVEEPSHHWLVTAPSVSPENSFFTPSHQKTQVGIGPTLDNELLRDLFDHTREAAIVLGVDKELGAKLAAARDRLPPTRIGKHGQVREWLEDYDEPEVTHRHVSPLYAFYPSNQITEAKTPELVKAVETTLQRRGEENRGWSGAWKINLRARLKEGDGAESLLRQMLTDVSIHPRAEDSTITPSFEGNQGIHAVTSGMAEMLLQSHEASIRILPALPKAWPAGKVEGLRARGGFIVDIAWQNGALTQLKVKSTQGQDCRLAYGGKSAMFKTSPGREYLRNGDLQ